MVGVARPHARSVWCKLLLVFGALSALRPLKSLRLTYLPTAYAKAVAIGALLAIGGGALWAAVDLIFISLGLVVSVSAALLGLVVGYAAGELINGAVNAKRGKGLAYIAAGSVGAAFIFGQTLYSGRVGFVGLVVLAVSVYMAVQRVK